MVWISFEFLLRRVPKRIRLIFYVKLKKYNGMKKLFTLLAVGLLGITMWGCQYDDDDLWKEIDGIKTQLAELNKEVSTLQTLVEALRQSKTITDVKQTADGYTITFNDNTSVTIADGKDGHDGQNAPEVGIDLFEGTYYWTVGGKGKWLTDAEGNKIPVAGEDGHAPQMAVDAEGYWTVDGLRIKDASGSEVKASGKDGDAFFASVDDGDLAVTFTLTDGTAFVIPKASATVFGFVLPADSRSFLFGIGEEKVLALDATDVTAADFMNIPQGWTAELNLDEKQVKVTAPVGTTWSEGILSLVGIDKNGKTVLASVGICAVDYSDPDGAFVLNEGNMTSDNGSLIYISPAGKVVDRAYWRANGSTLGNATQDLYIADGKMYVISQNGNRDGGDGLLVVADARTLKRTAAYNDELSALSWPTHVAVVGKTAYIRDNAGVHGFDLDTKALTFVEGSKGALKNRMAVVGDKVFVPASRSVLVIRNGAVEHTIAFEGAISGVIPTDDGNLWVSCTTSPARISKVNAADYTLIQTNTLGDYKVGAGWGATPGISAKGDVIYFSNATSTICRHTFSTNRTESLTDVKSHISNVGMAYNNLAVHPRTGEVYFNSIKGYGMDCLVNDITVFDFSAATPLLRHDYKNYTRFPAGVFFTAGF